MTYILKNLFSLLLILIVFEFTVFGQPGTGTESGEGTGTESTAPDANLLKNAGATDEQIKKVLNLKDDNQKSEFGTIDNQAPTIEEYNGEGDEDLEDEGFESELESLPQARIFGHNFFRNRNLRIYQTVADMKAPDNYVLGAGDRISLSVWGYSEYDGNFIISKDGYIKPLGVGRVYLKGLTYANAKSLITRKFSNYLDLQNSQIAISLVYSRVINVNIVGEVFNPGTYKIPAINSAFNALIAAGGPNNIGSVRKIFVKRNGKNIKTLDVYDYLLNKDNDQDFYLQNNAYIFVPPAERIVKIAGEVKKPFDYELKEGENFFSLINFASGLKATAYTETAQVRRYLNNEFLLIDVAFDSLKKANEDFALLDGDSVEVLRIPDIINNLVEIIGAVKLPGTYEFGENLRLTDLIEKAEGIIGTAYLERAYITRLNDDLSIQYIPINLLEILTNPASPTNMELQRFDVVEIFSKEAFRENFKVEIFGAVRREGEFVYGEGMTLKDLLYFSGGLKKEAANNRIEIARILNFDESIKDAVPTRTVIKTIQIGQDLEIDTEAENFEIVPLDQVFVRKTPEFETQQHVLILGEVNYPGKYSLESDHETFLDLIGRAGGFTEKAFIEGIRFFRVREKNNRVFIFMDYEKAKKDPKSKFNYILQEGDEIIVPELNQLVMVEGAIKFLEIDSAAKISTPYFRGKKAKYYVKKYGAGFTKDARKKLTMVQWPNGLKKRTKNYGLFKIYPRVKEGSLITVNAKPAKPPKVKKEKGDGADPALIHTTISGVTASITSAVTLFILIRNLNK